MTTTITATCANTLTTSGSIGHLTRERSLQYDRHYAFAGGRFLLEKSPARGILSLRNSAFRSKPEGEDTLSPDQPLARRIARRLISSHRSERSEGDSAAPAAAAACDHLYDALSRWVGPDGCHALFGRAIAEARTEYPALTQIQLRARSQPYIDGVPETIMSHGDAATAEALESMLVHVVELLGRLIGDDMATQLIERSVGATERGDTSSDSRREEA